VTTFLALFRAVNVGGRSVVSSAELCGLASSAGFDAPRTALQSGNLVFSAPSAKAAAIEDALESAAAEQLRLQTEVVVRTAEEWQRLIEANPFPAEAERDPSHMLVMPLKRAAKPDDVRALQAAIKGREEVRAVGAQLYLVYPDGIGRSKLTASVIEKAVGTRGTARNWNTVLKLHALAGRP
jgi:uncharacterized protein (DUF1697 family)